MRLNIPPKDILPFIGFFLITIGNGEYISTQTGSLVEYIGLLVLMLVCISKATVNFRTILRTVSLCFLLSVGSVFQKAPIKASIMIAGTSLLLICFSTISDNLISTNRRVKVMADAILCGAIFSAVVGLFTSTLGLNFGSKSAIVGILFLSGFAVKNYCGGVWLLLFMLYYTYYLREGKIKEKAWIFYILLLLLLLSGSKAAVLLSVIFLALVNYKRIIHFRVKQKKTAILLMGVIVLTCGLYVYNALLPQVTTYAYRIRGLSKLWAHVTTDIKRLMFGISEIAYANTGKSYVVNMRNFLGWEASVEMAYVNILIKNGLLGAIAWIYIYSRFLKLGSSINQQDRDIVFAVLSIMLISGFVETYIVSIHYVVGPVLYCLVNGLIRQTRQKPKEVN